MVPLRKSYVLLFLLSIAISSFGQAVSTSTSTNPIPEAPGPQKTLHPKTPQLGIEPQGWLNPGADPENRLVSPFVKHLVQDQRQFWTSPARLHTSDLKWMLPAAGVAAAFVASDSWWSKQVPVSHEATSKKLSDYGTYSLIGLTGASFLLGHIRHDDQLSEAGLLSGEAALNAVAVAFAFKEVAQRQRPYQGNGHGNFFAGGSSFPSMHSTVAWSVASVWAHEYPGWASQVAAYGLASAISMTRVTARQHFPSDVIIGSALGWYFARQVYRAHHDPELGGSGWSTVFDKDNGEITRNPNNMASPYVPVDSWIYPALERLVALGYVRSNILGIRPWTRLACAHLLQDAEEKFADDGVEDGDAGKTYAALTSEFKPEIARLNGDLNHGAQVQSVYTRMTGISGTPVRDGFHFGQTIVNDYGRPYWSGFNNVTGITTDAEAGPVSVYLRGEYQRAPAMPSESPQTLAATAAADFTPALPNGTLEANRFALLDSMASFTINNVQVSAGMQSAWLGPDEFGSFLISDNAAPFPMVKIDDVVPHEIPAVSRILGPFRTEFFIGQLSGQHWEYCNLPSCQTYLEYPDRTGPNVSPQPFIHGDKISFQPTPNLEFGMGITAMFGGPGLPVTFRNFFRTYYAHSSTLANDPGKRISQADFTYRIPGLRDWLTFYMDSLVVDEVSPIGSTRASVSPGIYMPRIPKIAKLELRAEGINESRDREFSPGFVYADSKFLSGYTKDNYLLGSWIGRAGRGGEGWLKYSLSPRNTIQVGYRLQTVSPKFIQGGRLADYSADGNFLLSQHLAFSGMLQYEQWRFPALSSVGQSNVTASVQLTYYPKFHQNDGQ